MAWRVEWDAKAVKELQKLDKQLQKSILRYLRERIAVKENPRRLGRALAHDQCGLGRYRVQNVRIICSIDEQGVLVLVLRVGHRKNVYR